MTKMIEITTSLAHAINTFVGKDVVLGRHVGRAFYRGTPADGKIELTTLPGVNDGAPNDIVTIVTSGAWETHYYRGGPCQFDKERFFEEITTTGRPVSSSSLHYRTDSAVIDSHVATVVIAILFGRDEVGRPLTAGEEKLFNLPAARAVSLALATAAK